MSSNQGKIDWAKVAKSDIKFAIVRASFGADPDRSFEKNLNQARANGLRVGAYHRIGPQAGSQKERNRNATKHARAFVEQLKKVGDPRDLVPVVDVEPPFSNLTEHELEDWIRAWTTEVQKGLGVKAMIYTSADVWEESVGDSTVFAKNGHRLWIADIDRTSRRYPPTRGAPRAGPSGSVNSGRTSPAWTAWSTSTCSTCPTSIRSYSARDCPRPDAHDLQAPIRARSGTVLSFPI